MEPVTYDNSVQPAGSFGGNWKWYAVGAVIGVAFIMYLRKRSQASTTSAANGAAAPNPVSGTAMDTGAQQSLQGINDQLAQLLQGQQNGQPPTSTTAGSEPQYTDTSNYSMVGTGWKSPGLGAINTPQGWFAPVRTPAEANALEAGSQSLYWMPTPNVMSPTQSGVGLWGNNLQPGTEIYEQVQGPYQVPGASIPPGGAPGGITTGPLIYDPATGKSTGTTVYNPVPGQVYPM